MTEDNSIRLTFSKKNSDVAKILKEISKEGIKKTDYICEAVRFFHLHKDDIQSLRPFNELALDEKVKELVYRHMKNYINNNCLDIIKTPTAINISGINKEDLEDD